MDMSSMMSGGAAAVAESLLRRSLLLASERHANIQSQTDCAELAIAIGDRDSARTLYELTFLLGGFSPAEQRRQHAIARQTGLWAEEPLAAPPPVAPGRFSVDLALAELGGLIGIAGLPALPEDGAELIEERPIPAGDQPTSAPQGLASDACGQLCRALRQEDGGSELDRLLVGLRETILAAPTIDLRDHVGEDSGHLAALLAFRALQDFLRRNHAVAVAPFGSAGLFHAASRLDRAGLGPYFDNVGNILRSTRDLFALIRMADAGRGQGPAGRAGRDRWLVLLSAHLDRSTNLDLIDELADEGDTAPLWGILARAAQRSQTSDEREILWRIRDAGLDCNDMRLAVRAQELIARLFVNNPIEWRVLGDMRGTIGDDAGAEAAFAKCLLFSPDDKGVRERIEALAAGDFFAFEIFGGLGTPLLRRQRRVARWATIPADPLAETIGT